MFVARDMRPCDLHACFAVKENRLLSRQSWRCSDVKHGRLLSSCDLWMQLIVDADVGDNAWLPVYPAVIEKHLLGKIVIALSNLAFCS